MDLCSFMMNSSLVPLSSLVEECKRRGISTNRKRQILAELITSHAERHPSGFKSMDRSHSASVAPGTVLASIPDCFVAAMASLSDENDDNGAVGGKGVKREAKDDSSEESDDVSKS